MTGILMDDRTGGIVLNEYNNCIEVDDKTGFEQVIDNLFHCDVGSERMNPLYGFDLKTAIRGVDGLAPEMSIESLVISALDTEKEKLISNIGDVKATRDGRTMNIEVVIESIFGDTVLLEQDIG